MADKEKPKQEPKEVIEIDYSDLFKHHKQEGDKPAERGGRDSHYNGVHR